MCTLKNYLILECELKEEEYIKRNEVKKFTLNLIIYFIV